MVSGWDPVAYQAHSTIQARLAAELLDRLDLRPGDEVLDLGCGDGKITAALAERVPDGRVVGLDSSAAMIAFAQESFPVADHPNLSFVVGDAPRLAFVAEFDLVVSFACLHWVADHEAVLRGVRQALRPGGRLLFQCGGAGNCDEVLPYVAEALRRPDRAARFADFVFPWSFYPAERHRAWVPAAGLKLLRAELVPKSTAHQGAAGLAGWLRTTWHPYLTRLAADDREPFLDEVVAAYIAAHPADAQGQVLVPMVRLEVEARRA